MKKYACALSLLLGSLLASAQNLVPNGSFEEYTNCPPSFGYIENVVGWEFAPLGSPDFYHTCHTGLAAGVPHNTCGFQYPSHGLGYTGIITRDYSGDYGGEIMSVELDAPLVVGVPIFLSFKLSPGGFGIWDGNSALYTTSGVGMKFCSQLSQDWLWYGYPNSAALSMAQVPTDTAAWYSVEGWYVPDSAYTHLMIGNFFADSLESHTVIDSTGFANTYRAYAFIDEVCVSYDPGDCDFAQRIRSLSARQEVRATSPFHGQLQIWLPLAPSGLLHIALTDMAGRQVWTEKALGLSKLVYSVPDVPDGIYVLQLSGQSGDYLPIRVVHQSP